MGLVIRGNGIYLYRSIRKDGRVTSEYRGSGLLALLGAEDLEDAREESESRREARAALDRECGELDRGVAGLVRGARSIAVKYLEASGYHRHARGQWRRRRGGGSVAQLALTDGERLQLRHACNGRSVAENWALERLVDFVRGSFGEKYKDSRNLEDHILRDMARSVEEFTGPDPTPMERVLARAAAFDLCTLKAFQARAMTAEAAPGSMSLAARDYLQRRVDRAHRRLMRTLRMLANVRRLATPPINVVANVANFGGEQPRSCEGPPAREALPR